VGETIAAVPLVKRIQADYPDKILVITTTTLTGSERVKSIFSDDVYHFYAPYDLPYSVKRFLKKIHPNLLIIMETELWPNMIHYCSSANISVLIANARMSNKSTRGYQKFPRFTEKMLKQISYVVAQYENDGKNFLKLGLPESKLIVAGNMKFDSSLEDELPDKASKLKDDWSFMGKRKIFLAASTHAGEDEIILEAYKQIKKIYPELLLILVPRHPERFNNVARLCSKNKLNFIRRSDNKKITINDQILLGDTMGELKLFYGLCDVAFVGGSLFPIGGHSLIEPAIWGVPIISGPHLHNFLDVSKLLEDVEGLLICVDSKSMAEIVCGILKDHNKAKQMGNAAQLIAYRHRGALEKTISIINSKIS
jgi:3-deoxy-D-manno-octulosonic-acid transferase